MTTEQQIRAEAMKAAASCPLAATFTPMDLIKVAGMMEAYITSGSDAAQEVADSWTADARPRDSSGTSADAVRPNDVRDGSMDDVQGLADKAYWVTTRAALRPIIVLAKEKGLGDETVRVNGGDVLLRNYLNARWEALKDASSKSNVPLQERNASHRKSGPPPSLRSELGL